MEEEQSSVNSLFAAQRPTGIETLKTKEDLLISANISPSQEESSLLNEIMGGSEAHKSQSLIDENEDLDSTLLDIFESKNERKRPLEPDILIASEEKAKKKKISIPKFKVALLNSSVASYKEALVQDEGISSHKIKGGIPGAIFFKKEEVRAAPWVSILLDSVEPSEAELPAALSANTEKIDSGIVFVEENSKKFAFPFGKGHHLLRKEALDHEFGLRVALNAINPEKVKSLGCLTLNYNPKLTFTSYNLPSNFNRFAFDTDALMKHITASVDNNSNNTSYTMSGSGAYVTIGRKWEMSSLPKVCNELSTLSQDESYKRKYPWVENIRPLTEKSLISNLNVKLLSTLKGDPSNNWYVSRPFLLEMEDKIGSSAIKYKIVKSGDEYYSLEEIAEYIKSQLKKKNVSIDTFKKRKVKGFDENEEECESWSLYDSIVYEVKENNTYYLLHEGKWFKIDPDYAKKVDSYVNGLYLKDEDLPKFPLRKQGEREEDYARRLASNNNNYLLLDQRTVYPNVSINPTDIEVCDLLSMNRELIHIKIGTDSAVLSHLFSQGRISALILKQDPLFRLRTKDKFLRAELLELLRKEIKPTIKKIKQKWKEKAHEDDWSKQMEYLLAIDEKIFGGIRNGKKFNQDTIKKEYEDSKKKKTAKNGMTFKDYIWKYYKKYIFEQLGIKFNQSCKSLETAPVDKISDTVKNKHLENCYQVLGKKRIDPLKQKLEIMCDNYQSLFDKLLPKDDFNSHNYKVMYGIITNKKSDKLSSIIPFFSRINLMGQAQEIQREGYAVVVKRIEAQE